MLSVILLNGGLSSLESKYRFFLDGPAPKRMWLTCSVFASESVLCEWRVQRIPTLQTSSSASLSPTLPAGTRASWTRCRGRRGWTYVRTLKSCVKSTVIQLLSYPTKRLKPKTHYNYYRDLKLKVTRGPHLRNNFELKLNVLRNKKIVLIFL
jgi:hypothetical protein